VVKDADAKVVGRAFSGAAIELALASYPGFTLTTPPADGAPYGVYTPAYIDAGQVEHTAVLPGGERSLLPPSQETRVLVPVEPPVLPAPWPPGPTRRVPLGRIAAARSGDKGGTANIGLWVRTDEAWRWLAHALTVEALRELLPETKAFPIERHVFPRLRGVNFVVDGLLGEGVSSSTRFDPQGKALGEWLRSRQVDVPEALWQGNSPD
jgi:hypothetical protein